MPESPSNICNDKGGTPSLSSHPNLAIFDYHLQWYKQRQSLELERAQQPFNENDVNFGYDSKKQEIDIFESWFKGFFGGTMNLPKRINLILQSLFC